MSQTAESLWMLLGMAALLSLIGNALILAMMAANLLLRFCLRLANVEIEDD